ncbi:MAG: protein MalT [Desulfobacterales bacterium]|nr:protein MalT [Desulfobacterales bacterium]
MSQAGFDIPELPDVLNRPRLFDLFRARAHCRIVLVTGQAAQGKSTLVADYLSRQDAKTLWFHLTPAASDHGVLFDLLSKGFGHLDHGSQPGVAPPHITLGSHKDLLRRIDLLVTLLRKWDRPLNIVLDDLETIDSQGTAFDFIEHLISESPGPIRFFLLSRKAPKLNLTRFRMEKQLLCLENTDLAFTREETLAFFQQLGADFGELDVREIEKIISVTEGWAGGLVLVSESVRLSRGIEQLPERLTSEAFSYFSDEIYLRQPEQIRSFLMTSALFDELDTRILSSFFKDIEPRDVLDRLEKRNLFIQKIKPDSKWPVFKYNNLFRDFLRSDLENTVGKENILSLNRRAGMIYWENKIHDKAVSFLIAGQDYRQVADIIRIKGAGDLISGRSDQLAEWISALPKEISQSDPWLVFFSTAARRIKGGRENISAFQNALKTFSEQEDIRGMLLCIAYLIEAAVFIRQPSRVILRWIDEGEALLERLKGMHRYTWARTLLWQQIGLGYIAGNGDIPKGISACRNALLLARRIENQDLMLNASTILTLGFVQSGDFANARDMLGKISTYTGEGQYPEYRALKNITNIDFAIKKGDLDLASQLLSQTETDIEKFGLIFLYPGFVEAQAALFTSLGQFNQAVQAADHLSDFSILEGNEFYMGISHRIKSLVSLYQEDYPNAVESANLAIEGFGRTKRGNIHLNIARQIKGISLFQIGELEKAHNILEPVLIYFDKIGSDLSFCETAFVLCLIKPDQELLLTAFNKAKENQYLRFPLLNNKILGKAFVLAGLANEMTEPLVAYYKTIQTQSLSDAVDDEVLAILDAAKKKERSGLTEKLFPLYRISRPTLFIQTFGAFRVKINGRSLDPSVFGGGKPVLLLKAIVLKGGKDIPKEVLIDTLWPDASVAAGEKNFKINLHRLRKALEPNYIKSFGYLFISQKSGRVSLDSDLVSLDTQLFEDLAGQGVRYMESGQFEQSLLCFSKAIEFYHGDYFGDDPYLEWGRSHRDYYRQKCIEVLEKIAGLHRSLDNWQDAIDTWMKILSFDPCSEKAFRKLMTLYYEAGMKTEALRLFDRCKDILRTELDAEPEALTIEIYNKVKGR